MGFVVFVVVVGIIASLWFFGAAILAIMSAVWVFTVGVASVALIFGTVPFWLLVTAATLWIAYCLSDKDSDTDDEYDGGWSVTALVTVLLFGAIIAVVNHNMVSFEGYSVFWTCLLILGSFGVYLVVGGLWSIFRFDRLGTKRVAMIEAWKRERFAVLAKSGLSDEQMIVDCINSGPPKEPNTYGKAHDDYKTQQNLYRAACDYKDKFESMIDRARPNHNMDRIMFWIGLWPWSVIGYVLRDPVKFVHDLLIKVYEASYNRTVGKIEVQFKTVFSENSSR